MATMPTGWECPRCHRIWAPHVDTCRECHPPARIGPAIGIGSASGPVYQCPRCQRWYAKPEGHWCPVGAGGVFVGMSPAGIESLRTSLHGVAAVGAAVDAALADLGFPT